MAEAIEMPFASMTLVRPGKHLLRIGRTLYCVHSTQHSLLVCSFNCSTKDCIFVGFLNTVTCFECMMIEDSFVC